jgi:membrane protein required for colicin V production
MNTVDAVVIGIIVVSTVIAFLRGFVREMLTVGSWIGAALVTLYGFPVVTPKFEHWIASKLAADIIGSVTLFLLTLIIFSLLSHAIARFVRGSALTAVDRSLGLLFGLARGAVLVSLAYMLMFWLDPNIVRGARTEPMMRRGAEILRDWAPSQFANDLPADLRLPPAPAADQGSDTRQDTAPNPVYNRHANDDMQRLIDTTSRK